MNTAPCKCSALALYADTSWLIDTAMKKRMHPTTSSEVLVRTFYPGAVLVL